MVPNATEPEREIDRGYIRIYRIIFEKSAENRKKSLEIN